MELRSASIIIKDEEVPFVALCEEGLIQVIMSQDNLVKFECSDCHRINYQSTKNKKKLKTRLELKKFCNWCRKHVMHKETK